MSEDAGLPAPVAPRAIYWPMPGRAEVRDTIPVPDVRPGDVLVQIAVSVTSPGTERARFLGLPTAKVRFPHVPGYMAAGILLEAAPGLPEGARVAVRRVAHQSVAVAPPAHLHAVPDGVAMEDAALWELAVTALNGLARGAYRPGEPITVVGAGLLGAITRRLAHTQGPGSCLVVASSDAKRWTTRAEPSTTFVSGADIADAERRPLVVDLTDTPDGLATAIALTADGGRVVLLGSPRADAARVPVEDVQARGLRVVGAHIDTLGPELEGRLTEEFFVALATGAASFTDLLAVHHPGDAPFVYRRLALDRSFVGAAFDWMAPSPRAERATKATTVRSVTVACVRFALLGCGDIGATEADAIAAADGVELVACFDPVDALATEVAEAHDAVVVRSVAEALERSDVDAVLVATPHDTHEALALAALDAGKHLLMEKPLAADLASAARIAEAAGRASSITSVLFPLRYDERFLAARAAIDAGLLGTPQGVVATYLIDHPASYFFGGYSSRSYSTWRQSKTRSGGGILIMNVIHHLDAVRALLGVEAESVYAAAVPSDLAPDIEDVTGLVARFGSAVATFMGGAAVVGEPGQALRMWGSDGHLTVLPQWGSSFRRAADDPAGPVRGSVSGSRTRAIERFAGAVATGASPDVSVADALAVQALVAAAYGAATTGDVVSPGALLREARS